MNTFTIFCSTFLWTLAPNELHFKYLTCFAGTGLTLLQTFSELCYLKCDSNVDTMWHNHGSALEEGGRSSPEAHTLEGDRNPVTDEPPLLSTSAQAAGSLGERDYPLIHITAFILNHTPLSFSCFFLYRRLLFLSGGAPASGTLSTAVRWGRRSWRWSSRGQPRLHRVQPCRWSLCWLWLHLRLGVLGERDRPGGHCLHHPSGGQGRPRLCVGPPDGEAGDVLCSAGLPPGQVHHCRPGPANSWGNVPVRAAHGVHLQGRDVQTPGGVCSTQKDLRLHPPEDEPAVNWRGSRWWGWWWRWGVFGGTCRHTK